MTDYANIEERNAAIENIKQQCRDLIATLQDHRPGQITAMPIYVDGVWGDYWYIEQDGQPVGDIQYDGFGPVVKGDALSKLVYRATRAAELAAA